MEKARLQVCDRAKVIYSANNKIPLSVYIGWIRNMYPNKRVIPRLSDLLAKFAQGNIPENVHQPNYIEIPETSDNGLLGEYVSGITIIRMKDGPGPWTSTSAIFSEIDSAEIQEVLNRKEGKIPNYERGLSSYWLVILSGDEPLFISSSAQLANAAQESSYTTSFDRVFWFDRNGNQVITLRVLPPESLLSSPAI